MTAKEQVVAVNSKKTLKMLQGISCVLSHMHTIQYLSQLLFPRHCSLEMKKKPTLDDVVGMIITLATLHPIFPFKALQWPSEKHPNFLYQNMSFRWRHHLLQSGQVT